MPAQKLAELQNILAAHFDPRLRAGKAITPCPDCGGIIELFYADPRTGICTNCRTEFRFRQKPLTRDDLARKWLRKFAGRST